MRRRGKGQIEKLKNKILRFRQVVPVLVTGSGEIVDGHGIVEACQALGYANVAVIVIDYLGPAEIRALRLSLNRLSEESVWDQGALKLEFEYLYACDPMLVPFTGYEIPQVDAIMWLASSSDTADPADEQPVGEPTEVVSCLGDLWICANQKLYCGNARDQESYHNLLGNEEVQMVLSDPPYGCSIQGHVSRTHGEFLEGSGMSDQEAEFFFASFLAAMKPHLLKGAIVDLFIDGQGMLPLLSAVHKTGFERKALCVWDKQAGGMGSLYRQQAEFIVVAKYGKASHINNIQLGKHGRNRTTVWAYPGLAQFGPGRAQALAIHPTVKPVGLLADALLDTSQPGGVVLDPFAGTGTTLIAAHRTHRLGRGIELSPVYVDFAVRRLEDFTGEPVRHAATGLTFTQMAEQRRTERDRDSELNSAAVPAQRGRA